MTLKELLARATPRPWKEADRGYVIEDEGESDTESWGVFSLSDAEKRPAEANGDTGEQAEANAILIAHAVNVLPRLVEAANEVLLNTGVDQYPAPRRSLDKLRSAIDEANTIETANLQSPHREGGEK